MNAYMSEPLQPFRVDAKVLRPGSLAQTTSNQKPYGDTVTRAIEIVLMLALTAASVPFIATGIVWGFIYLIALVGALYLLVTAGVLAGLYGVWSLLLRSDATLLAGKPLRDSAVSSVVIGIITAAAIAAWVSVTMSSPRVANADDLWRVYCIIALPVAIGLHRIWRLHQILKGA